ncbi:MAG: hypothetical protein O2960_23155 [Verrucomicrobia bacterium]|nr:hypothetical protein [Verrucomicrobiota bacterium]
MAADEKLNRAWRQPFTFGGVASFASAPAGKLFFVQILAACIVAAVTLGFVCIAWKPVVDEAIVQLPERAVIRNGTLTWEGLQPNRLAGNPYLSIVVELDSIGSLGSPSDLQIELGKRGVRTRSILGYIPLPYPTRWIIPANRNVVEPWWGAWKWLILAALGGALISGLIVMWWIVGILYAWPIRLIAFYADRDVTLWGAWLLSNASLIPGALLFGLAILGYGLQQLNLIQLLFAHLLHLMIGWIFMVCAVFQLPRQQTPKRRSRSSNLFSE